MHIYYLSINKIIYAFITREIQPEDVQLVFLGVEWLRNKIHIETYILCHFPHEPVNESTTYMYALDL